MFAKHRSTHLKRLNYRFTLITIYDIIPTIKTAKILK
jgi:hypothetical protein